MLAPIMMEGIPNRTDDDTTNHTHLMRKIRPYIPSYRVVRVPGVRKDQKKRLISFIWNLASLSVLPPAGSSPSFLSL